MDWIKGAIPDDGKLYVTATPWLNIKNGTTRMEVAIAYLNEDGHLCDSNGDEIFSHGGEDIEFYFPIPPFPED